jgi:hypothetical protein
MRRMESLACSLATLITQRRRLTLIIFRVNENREEILFGDLLLRASEVESMLLSYVPEWMGLATSEFTEQEKRAEDLEFLSTVERESSGLMLFQSDHEVNRSEMA